MSGAVDIQIPPGSVADLDDAVGWHRELARSLDEDRQRLVGSSFTLATRWEGVAAATYQEYSEHVVARYGAAAEQAREIAHMLSGWARALEDDQKRSRDLLERAEVIAREITVLKRAAAVSSTASAAAKAAAAGEAKRLAALEAELKGLEHEGAVIYEDAERLAAEHNRYLNGISVTPPDLLNPATGATTVHAAVAGVGAGVGAGAGAPLAGLSSSPGSATPANAGAPAPTDVPLNLTSVSAGASQGAITFGDLEKIGRQYGWSNAQDQAWWKIIQLESGGRSDALNPSSGAYGIGQFLGSTMKEYAPYGAASPNPMDQLNAMAKYINDRYGSPTSALSFHLANGWY